VGQGDDAVDVLELVERSAAELVGDHLRRRGGAVHAGEDRDEVARADPPVRPPETAKGGAGAVGHREIGVGAAQGGLACALLEAEVVRVHVVARGDVGGRDPDDLPVLVHLGAGGHCTERDLVPPRHRLPDGDRSGPRGESRCARAQVAGRDGDVVTLAKNEQIDL
jgi:hypothetical protein